MKHKSTHVTDWINMLVNPLETEIVRSPAGNAVLGSKTRIIENLDIAYGDTLGGHFSVIARPSLVQPLTVARNPVRLPAAGDTLLIGKTMGLTFTSDAAPAGYPSEGTMGWHSDTEHLAGQLVSITDSGALTRPGFYMSMKVATNVWISISNSGNNPYSIRVRCRISGGAWTYLTSATKIPSGGSVIVYDGTPASQYDAVTFEINNQAGSPTNPDHDLSSISASVQFTGYIPVATTAGSVSEFVSQKLIAAAGVTNCRVTAMSLLVTNMASATHDGGELVMACTRQSVAFGAPSTAALMTNIKKLPEGNRWHSGVMKDGGYTFYVPDDLASYEPHDYSTINFQDNCCIAAGKMDESGVVRVVATYIVEFYTRVQLFERAMGPAWTAEYKLAHRYIQTGRMASGNEDHRSMTQRIKRNVQNAWNFALAHRNEIEAGANILAALLL